MAKVKIFISANGNVVSLYSEPLAKFADQIGFKQIYRASDVEFNNETQLWEVIMGKVIVATGKTRQEALDKEKEIVENGLRTDVCAIPSGLCTNSSQSQTSI